MKIMGRIEAVDKDRVYVTFVVDNEGSQERFESHSELKHFKWDAKAGDEFIIQGTEIKKLDPKPISPERMAQIIKETENIFIP